MARSVFTQTNKMAIKINYKILSQLKNQLELVGSTVPSNCLVEVVKCGGPVSGGGNVVFCFLLLSTVPQLREIINMSLCQQLVMQLVR